MSKLSHTISWIIVAMIAGTVLGLMQPTLAVQFAPFAKLVLQLIKAIAAPLVFFAVLEAVLRYHVKGGDFLKLLTITLINIYVITMLILFSDGDFCNDCHIFHLNIYFSIFFYCMSFSSDIIRVTKGGNIK